MTLLVGSAVFGIVLSPSSASVDGIRSGGTCYAGIQFNSSGEELSTPDNGDIAYSESRGNYIDSGAPDNVWIQWTRTSGTLGDWNSEDSGDARVQLSSSAAWRISRSGIGDDTIAGDFDFYDAAAGGSLLATVSLAFSAEVIA